MNTHRIAAITLGVLTAAFWPAPIGAALADETHHVPAVQPAGTAKPASPASKAKPESKGERAKSETAEESASPKREPGSRAASEVESKPEKPIPVTPASNEGASSAAKSPAESPTTADSPSDSPTADQALRFLVEGNARWASGTPTSPNIDATRRARLAEQGQHPFAIVLTCADSRVPAERLFDRGVGDIFTVRVAGNIAGNSETGTIDYAVEHLKSPVLVVMGHTKCGAVSAACSKAEAHGRLADLLHAISPAVDRTQLTNPGLQGPELAAAAVRENVWQSIFDLVKGSDVVRAKLNSRELTVVGAVYDIASGKVEFMGEHPWQSELLEAMNARATAKSASAQAEEVHH